MYCTFRNIKGFRIISSAYNTRKFKKLLPMEINTVHRARSFPTDVIFTKDVGHYLISRGSKPGLLITKRDKLANGVTFLSQFNDYTHIWIVPTAMLLPSLHPAHPRSTPNKSPPPDLVIHVGVSELAGVCNSARYAEKGRYAAQTH
jgi:hypothetical protein